DISTLLRGSGTPVRECDSEDRQQRFRDGRKTGKREDKSGAISRSADRFQRNRHPFHRENQPLHRPRWRHPGRERGYVKRDPSSNEANTDGTSIAECAQSRSGGGCENDALCADGSRPNQSIQERPPAARSNSTATVRGRAPQGPGNSARKRLYSVEGRVRMFPDEFPRERLPYSREPRDRTLA